MSENVPNVPAGGNTISPASKVNPRKSWCFTYHLEKGCSGVPESQQLIAAFTSRKCDYIFALEHGKSGATPHLQGWVAFPTKARWSVFGLPKQIHWEGAKGNKEQNVAYTTKEGGQVWTNLDMTPKNDKFTECLSYDELYDWQKYVEGICTAPTEKRWIYYIYDIKGNSGKTALQKRIASTLNAIVITGKCADMKYGIASYREKRKEYPKIVLVNQPRSVEHLSWDGIECIKDGLFFSTKYESCMHIYNCPHIIVFSNREPPKSTKLTEDRWMIYELIDGELHRRDPPIDSKKCLLDDES